MQSVHLAFFSKISAEKSLKEYVTFLPSPVTAGSELEMWKHHAAQHLLRDDLETNVKETH
jgi:hypothetical protein